MKTIGLIVNPEKDVGFVYTKRTVDILHNLGFTVVFSAPILAEYGCAVLDGDAFFAESDAIVTLGGDGTILGIAYPAAKFDKPILGINLGHLGYLAQLEKHDIERLPEILKTKSGVQKRSMLQISVRYTDGHSSCYHVLNDAVISRQLVSNTTHAELYSNDEYVYSYHCDGLIFSTPTGSTAYSMAAGGPIVDSNLQDIVIVTPVCEHSMFSKSMIFSGSDVLKCRVSRKSEDSFLILDGNNVGSMDKIEEFKIQKSEYSLGLFELEGNRFYKVLNNKFSDNRGVS